MPDGMRCRTNFLPRDIHRMAGVVPALVAGDDGKMRRQQIDDLALAFVTPLRAENDDVHRHDRIPGSVSAPSASQIDVAMP